MKKKTGRPRKRDNSKFLECFGYLLEQPPQTPEEYGLTKEQARHLERSLLIVDPLRNDPLMGALFAASITGIATKETQDAVGEMLADALHELNAEQLRDFFDRILKLKVEAERNHHRAVHAHQAFHDFVEEYGYEPTRQRLKDFMQKQPTVYLDLPNGDDSKGWGCMFDRATLPEMEPGYKALNE